MWRQLIILLVCCVPLTVGAELRHFVASLEESQWRITSNSPIACQLEHEIPMYGKAIFASQASKDMNLNFVLDMWVKPNEVTKAELISKAPSWRPGIANKKLTAITYQKYFDGEVPKLAAWSMLNELTKGMQPTFYYADWNNKSRRVAVGLSSVNFHRKYNIFKQCLSNLLPYSFNDIAFTVLNFKEGGTELTRLSQQQMNKVQEYLSYDADVELILIDAYTDSYGGRGINKKVSQQRADSIKEYFISNGVPKDKIVTRGHGETRHVAGNDTLADRARNRRLVIQIDKAS
ncbi:OmpA family protein [Parashewanella spongiae]|uniref:OmpA family protein n=1 Tax=Parashewanella spongiae TaxID=342950 RepID=A0A3A6TE58_9GAMM|nr:OmpA family protein [Parashewanella spongiae]MCL1079339.1 OmpA family protein [Parashewanella spongiae]RJY05090.1 OmpA family protein [Parashewanella spongiae]